LPPMLDVEEAALPQPRVVVHPDLLNYKGGYRGHVPLHRDPDLPNVCQIYKIRKGDIEEGFGQADVIVENRFTLAPMQHSTLESMFADAWFEPDGGIVVRSSSHLPWAVKLLISRLFDLSPSKVRVLSPYIGGCFGFKGESRAEGIAAMLAKKSGRPVRLRFTTQDAFVGGGSRTHVVTYIKDGVKKDGTLVAREMKIFFELGAHSHHGPHIVKRSPCIAAATYRVPNLKLDSWGVYTNGPMTCPVRGFGAPASGWPVEQQIDIIADKLGMDPIELRKKNLLNEGERDSIGMVTRPNGARLCLDKLAAWMASDEKTLEEAGPWRIGKGIALTNKSTMLGTTSVVKVKVWEDGTIEVRHGAPELGQGINTSLTQMAAEEFGVSVERIKRVTGDTALCPFDTGAVSSRGLIHNGNALLLAWRDAKRQLFEMAAPILGVPTEELDAADGKVYVKGAEDRSLDIAGLFNSSGIPLQGGEVLGVGTFTAPPVAEDQETGQSNRNVFTYSYTAVAVEVAVNVETGEVKVSRMASASDVGKAINPKVVEQQIEGGLVMGLGSALFEEVLADGGVPANISFADYRVPRTIDVPTGRNVETTIIEVPEPEGPLGAKCVGELTVGVIAPAIANAVYNAVGVRIKDLPLKKERVLAELKKLRKS